MCDGISDSDTLEFWGVVFGQLLGASNQLVLGFLVVGRSDGSRPAACDSDRSRLGIHRHDRGHDDGDEARSNRSSDNASIRRVELHDRRRLLGRRNPWGRGRHSRTD